MGQTARDASPGYDFFDVDHTVVDGATGLHFILTGIQSRVLPMRALLTIPGTYWQYYYREMDLYRSPQVIRALEGIPEEEITKLGRLNFEKRIRGAIFAEAEDLIRERVSSRRRIAFITSSFSHVVQPLADYLQVKDILANTLVYRNGITTGAISAPILFGEEKRKQALRFLAERAISPADCSFYTDSVNDLSLLEIVGKPVAVNPHRSLRRIALTRDWPIVEFRTHRPVP